MIANTADDLWIHGLKVCPDLDTVMYTLGEGIDLERGWGRRDETCDAKQDLEAYGVESTWFGLGDRDIATHLVRSQMLEAGYSLSEVTQALCRRWSASAVLGRRAAAADDGRPGRDPRRDRRSRGAERQARRPLPGVLGAAARRGAGRGAGLRRSGPVGSGTRCPRGHHRGRPRHPAAVQPGGVGGHHPRRSRHPGRAAGHQRAPSSASPPSSATPTCAAWRSRC